MKKDKAPGFSISGEMQQLFEDLPGWLQDQPKGETPEDLAAMTLPQATSDAIHAIGNRLRTERTRILEQHERQLRARRNVLGQALYQRQRRLQAYDEQLRNETFAKAEGEFVVAGRIVDESGASLPHVRVRAFDLDRKYDDLLRETRTDMMGYYRLEYDESDFKDLPDKEPETYIEVLDEAGGQLHTSSKSFVYKAGEVEVIDATIDATKVLKSQALGKMIARLVDDWADDLEKRNQRLNSRMSARPQMP